MYSRNLELARKVLRLIGVQGPPNNNVKWTGSVQNTDKTPVGQSHMPLLKGKTCISLAKGAR
jgi:hypothetical protein